MPDFKKGDFTQQGVNGHVNATVRLNEKRLVSIDLTSNEEAEGCTIAGNVTDLLNDKVYAIGSGVSGNIEITENGENINVAPYATATVNVSGGGGDNLIKCVVTLKNESGNKRQFAANTLAILNDDGTLDLHTPVLDVNETKIITLLLLTDAGDRLFCVVTDGAITTSNENDCLITDSCLYPSDETVTECSITIALK